MKRCESRDALGLPRDPLDEFDLRELVVLAARLGLYPVKSTRFTVVITLSDDGSCPAHVPEERDR